ncbi:MAG: response regulator [Pseudobdellovibrionaceae bacterium]
MFPLETRVLVVDDMPSIRELVKSQLKTMGYIDIHEAENGEHALQKILSLDAAGSPVQLVISDWNMPKLTGLEFLKQLRGNHAYQKIPFVLLTSEAERDQVTEAILAGVSQYVVKPFSGKVFEDKLKQVWLKHHAAGK